MWEESMDMQIANGLRSSAKLFRCKSKERFFLMQEKEKRFRTSLVSLQQLQERYPHCTWIAEKFWVSKTRTC